MAMDAHIDWLRQQIHKAAPTYIVFRRGDLSVVVTATKGKSLFESSPSEQYVHQSRSIDWLVNPADLVLSGSTTTPEDGDEIDELDGEGGNVVRTYHVSPESGEGPWSWSDQWRRMMRIHTILIGEGDE